MMKSLFIFKKLRLNSGFFRFWEHCAIRSTDRREGARRLGVGSTYLHPSLGKLATKFFGTRNGIYTVVIENLAILVASGSSAAGIAEPTYVY